jgi:hypothetical protein
MIIKKGYIYHIKQEYFNLVKDDKLMKNHEHGNLRPTYYCTKDKDGLYWFIPMSSQVEKYKVIVKREIKKYGKCNKIVVDTNEKSTFLLQNMFPCLPKYIDHMHTIKGNLIKIDDDIIQKIDKSFNNILYLHKKGIKVIFPDIDRLKGLMLKEQRKMDYEHYLQEEPQEPKRPKRR